MCVDGWGWSWGFKICKQSPIYVCNTFITYLFPKRNFLNSGLGTFTKIDCKGADERKGEMSGLPDAQIYCYVANQMYISLERVGWVQLFRLSLHFYNSPAVQGSRRAMKYVISGSGKIGSRRVMKYVISG